MSSSGGGHHRGHAAAARPALDVDAAIPFLRPPPYLSRGRAADFAKPHAPPGQPAQLSLGAMAAALEAQGTGARTLLQQATRSLREARQQRLSLRQLHEALAGGQGRTDEAHA